MTSENSIATQLCDAAAGFYNATIADKTVRIRAGSADARDHVVAMGASLRKAIERFRAEIPSVAAQTAHPPKPAPSSGSAGDSGFTLSPCKGTELAYSLRRLVLVGERLNDKHPEVLTLASATEAILRNHGIRGSAPAVLGIQAKDNCDEGLSA